MSDQEAIARAIMKARIDALRECLEIIRLAREGEIDGDLRSIRSRIEDLIGE